MKPRDALELVCLGGLWGASFLFMRVAAPAFGPLALIEVRVAVAAVVLCLLLAWRRQLSTLTGKGGKFLIIGAINSAVPFTLFAYSTLHLPAGFAAVLNATAPLFAAIIAYGWFRERLSPIRIAGLFIGFAGVLILVSSKLGSTANTLAIAAGLAAALLYGIAAHYSKRAFEGVPALTVATGNLIAATCILLPAMVGAWPSKMPGIKSWLCATALGIACTALAYVLFFRLIRNLGASRAITVTYLIPAFAMLWGYLLLGEPITATMLAGGAVIVVGTVLVNRS